MMSKVFLFLTALALGLIVMGWLCGCNTAPVGPVNTVIQFGSSTQPAQVIINGTPGMFSIPVTVNVPKLLTTAPAKEQNP